MNITAYPKNRKRQTLGRIHQRYNLDFESPMGLCAKLILSSLLVFVVPNAGAEWTRVRENDKVVFYMDMETLKKNGDLRRVWVSQDVKSTTPIPDFGLSGMMLYEFDCKGDRMRILSIKTFSGNRHGGTLLSSGDFPDKEWGFVPPNTSNAELLKRACSS